MINIKIIKKKNHRLDSKKFIKQNNGLVPR